jgi:hypothetical protein
MTRGRATYKTSPIAMTHHTMTHQHSMKDDKEEEEARKKNESLDLDQKSCVA